MILERFFTLIRSYTRDGTCNDVCTDPLLENYLDELFMVNDEGEFNVEDVSTLLKEYAPESHVIPSSVLTNWILETRTNLVTNAENGSKVGIDGDQVVNGQTPSFNLGLLADLIPSGGEINVNAKQLKKSNGPSGEVDGDSLRLTSEERLAVMERYETSPSLSTVENISTKSICGPLKNEGSKLRYLDGKVVDTTGKRYIEIKKEYPDMPKSVYLKAGRKYHFH